MTIYDLSSVNALLNFVSFILLVLGYREIKSGRKEKHKRYMLSAASCSVLFLVSYLVYHYFVGSVKFQGEGWSRPFYFTILLTHTVLAAALAPMAILTLYRGLTGNFELHKKIAKITFPVWTYVSVTGVLVYLMLYHIFAP
jgi:uncharacterized membrane protein YozB (DUF420 family)